MRKNPNLDLNLLVAMHMLTLSKFHQFVLKKLSGNEKYYIWNDRLMDNLKTVHPLLHVQGL